MNSDQKKIENSVSRKQHLKSYIPKTEITFDYATLGVENKFFVSKITCLPTYSTIIL